MPSRISIAALVCSCSGANADEQVALLSMPKDKLRLSKRKRATLGTYSSPSAQDTELDALFD